MTTDKPEAIPDPTPRRGIHDQGPTGEFLENLEPDLLLAYFVETALPLSEEEQKRFDAELAKEENKYVGGLLARMHEAIDEARGKGV